MAFKLNPPRSPRATLPPPDQLFMEPETGTNVEFVATRGTLLAAAATHFIHGRKGKTARKRLERQRPDGSPAVVRLPSTRQEPPPPQRARRATATCPIPPPPPPLDIVVCALRLRRCECRSDGTRAAAGRSTAPH
jgi:hypothetical protein